MQVERVKAVKTPFFHVYVTKISSIHRMMTFFIMSAVKGGIEEGTEANKGGRSLT